MASVLCRVAGAAGGVNEFSLRKLLRYSSINHLGWILLAISKFNRRWLVYFILYCAVLFRLVNRLLVLKMFHLNQLILFAISGEAKIRVVMGLFSLGGLPPLLGFLPKWILIDKIRLEIPRVILLLLVVSRVVTLYFYRRWAARLVLWRAQDVKNSFGLGWGHWASIVVNSLGIWLFRAGWVRSLH